MKIDHDKMNILFLLTPKSDVAFLFDHNTLRQGMEKMRFHGYTAIPVITDEGTYVGAVSEGDFLWFLNDQGERFPQAREEYLVRNVMRPDWCPPVKVDATMDQLLRQVMAQNFVPVVDDRGAFVGLIVRRDVLRWFYEK